MTKPESPFACDMSAIAADHRGAHLATIGRLFRAVESLRELPNGYAFRLPNESDLLLTAAEFITFERLCCPFFGFGLEIEREGGAVRLSLTGREGVKPFILAEIGDHLPEDYQSRHREKSIWGSVATISGLRPKSCSLSATVGALLDWWES